MQELAVEEGQGCRLDGHEGETMAPEVVEEDLSRLFGEGEGLLWLEE
jgi:hypothetical protein